MNWLLIFIRVSRSMNRQESSVGLLTAGSLIAVLGVDGLKLLLPQDELRTLEPVEDVKQGSHEHLEVGWISVADQQCPVFCVAGDLTVLGEIPRQRRIVVMLNADNELAGVLCDELNIVRSEELNIYPIPVSLRGPGSPLTSLAIYEDTVACMTSSHHLISYLRQSKTRVST